MHAAKRTFIVHRANRIVDRKQQTNMYALVYNKNYI
jgi:hypothetical protein